MIKKNTYKVSAIVSTYNSEEFIKGCLEDLLAQTLYKKNELEIIVINSGSEQNEDFIIQEFLKTSSHIKYIKTKEREGIYTAWNRGVKAASGKYLTNANTDDRHRPDALEILANALDINPDVQLVYANFYVTNTPNNSFADAIIDNEVTRPEFDPTLLLQYCFVGPQPMWRAEVHKYAGYFDESFKSSGDYEFWCRMVFKSGMKLKLVNEFLGLYYFNKQGIEHGNFALSTEETKKIQNYYIKELKKLANSEQEKYEGRYFQPVAGLMEKYIEVVPGHTADSVASSYQMLKNYPIRDFGSGLDAVEKIIEHIIVNKFSREYNLPDKFWNDTVTISLKADLVDAGSKKSFSESKPASMYDIDKNFAEHQQHREADISAYADLYRQGKDLGKALYISGTLLNQCFDQGEVPANGIFMVDGARRLTAAALAHIDSIEILMIIDETELSQFKNAEDIAKTAQSINELQWFNNYQNIPLLGIRGQRSLKRFDLMDLDLFKDQVVMDFGCNLGQASIKALQSGAKKVIGVEGMPDTFNMATQIGQIIGFENLNYLNVDFNHPDFDKIIDEQYPERSDYSFFFSVYRTKELTQRDRLFQYIIDNTRKGIFFEGHAHEKIDTIEYYDWLFESFGLQYHFLGYSEANLRPLFFIPLKSSEEDELNNINLNDQKKEYLVSAIVSTYKSEKFIKGKLDDLVNQSLGDKLEIIVIDSNSPENEGDVVREYQKKYKNIKYLRTDERETVYKAWNRGIKMASGKFITNSNTDDRLKNDALEVLAGELENRKDVDLVYADFYLTQQPNETFENHTRYGERVKPDYSEEIMLTGCHMGPQPMWRADLHSEIGYFNDTYISAGDYEFWCRMTLIHGKKLFHLKKFLGLYFYNFSGIELGNPGIGQAEAELIKETYAKYLHKKNVNEKDGGEKTDIVFLTYNRLDYFAQTIDHLIRNTRKGYNIIIVDNASDNDFRDYLARTKILYDHIILNENNEWTAAFQKGINVAKSDPFICSDPDILVPEMDGQCWLGKLTGLVKEDPEIGLLALNLDPSNLPPKVPDVYLGDKEEYNSEIILSNVGTVMQCIKRKYFNNNYVTDWETCELIRRKGAKVGFAKNIIAYHLGWNEETDYPDFLVHKHEFYKTVYGVDTYKLNTENAELLSQMDSVVENNLKKRLKVVRIIIPVFNNIDYSIQTVVSLLNLNENNKKYYLEIIIIDNGSEEKDSSQLNKYEQEFPNIKIIKNESNLGFPKAVNQGIVSGEYDYLIIANNDIIVTQGSIKRMIEVAESDPLIGIVGPISNEVSGVQHDKNARYSSIEEMMEYSEVIKEKFSGELINFPRVAFLFTLVKKEVVNKIGGLDERFTPGNYEDDDYCLRAQMAGYKTVVAKDVFIHHHGSKSFKAEGEEKYQQRLEINQEIFEKKWGCNPDEIWLQGKDFRKRSIALPLDLNLVNQYFKWTNYAIDDKDIVAAIENLDKCIESYNSGKFESDIELEKLLELKGKLKKL